MSYPGNPPPFPGNPQDGPYQPGPYPPPVAGPPPLSAPPLSGAPYSGPPGYPTAGYPTSGYPMSGVPAAPKRPAGTLILAALTAVFFLAAVVFTTLYITKSSAYNKQVATVRQRDRTIAADQSMIDNLRQQLRSTKDQLDDAQQKQSGTQNQLDEITKEKNVISNCLNLYDKVVTALLKNDKNTFNATFNSMKTACDEASRYVN
jgi:hypothetical protein